MKTADSRLVWDSGYFLSLYLPEIKKSNTREFGSFLSPGLLFHYPLSMGRMTPTKINPPRGSLSQD